ncbi:hypothetical protein MMC08_001522 [Hypocenomyce scalaris]|nr:hypothetical protein [Hypocenomyce scalaris]
MVCAKCQKLSKKTELATPGVKRKNDMYYGSPATTSAGSSDKSKTSATLGNNGVEQAAKQKRQEPLRRVLELMLDM